MCVCGHTFTASEYTQNNNNNGDHDHTGDSAVQLQRCGCRYLLEHVVSDTVRQELLSSGVLQLLKQELFHRKETIVLCEQF